MSSSTYFPELPPADLARTHLRPLATRPLHAPFVRLVLQPLVECGAGDRWQAKKEAWGIVIRLWTDGGSLDFVFWLDEARFSFFAGSREEMDEFLDTAEQAEREATWLREFLSNPYTAGGVVQPALLGPSDRE